MPHVLHIGALTFTRFVQRGWHGWLSCGWHFEDDVDAWLGAPGSEHIIDAPCRSVTRHPRADGNVYAKLMRAGNDGVIQNHEWYGWLKWAAGPSRAIHILKLSALMLAAGHLCPAPLLALRKRQRNGRHLNLIVTAEVLAPTVEQALRTPGDGRLNVVQTVAVELARLHDDRFLHGDFIPRNLCLQGNRLVFLDNDKSSHWPVPPPDFLKRRNLAQFSYALLVIAGMETADWTLPGAFLDAYAEAARWCRRRTLSELERIKPAISARWQHKRAKSMPAR